MIELSQQDLDVRLQLASCCIGDKTTDLLSKIKIGAKTVPCKLQELQVMQEMIDILKCYDVTLEEVLATGTIEITVIPAGTEITITVNGIDISGLYTRTTADQATEMALLATQINNYQDTYTAVFNAALGTNGKIVITSTTCDNVLMEAEVVNATVVVTGLEGTCLTDNCITEEEAQAMFGWIARKCNICFQPPGFDYE